MLLRALPIIELQSESPGLLVDDGPAGRVEWADRSNHTDPHADPGRRDDPNPASNRDTDSFAPHSNPSSASIRPTHIHATGGSNPITFSFSNNYTTNSQPNFISYPDPNSFSNAIGSADSNPQASLLLAGRCRDRNRGQPSRGLRTKRNSATRALS